MIAAPSQRQKRDRVEDRQKGLSFGVWNYMIFHRTKKYEHHNAQITHQLSRTTTVTHELSRTNQLE